VGQKEKKKNLEGEQLKHNNLILSAKCAGQGLEGRSPLLQKRYMNLKTSNFGPKYKPLCNNT
jgi:hypothetical protein